MTLAGKQDLSRRKLVASIALIGLGLTAAACSPGTSGPAATSPPAAPAKAAATTAAPAAAKPTFTRATVKMGNIATVLSNAMWSLGKKKGFFDEFGIDYQALGVKDDLLVLNSLVANEVDFADSGIEAPLAAVESGHTVKLLGSLRPALDFVVYSRKDINSLKDLEGRSVGTAAPGTFLDMLMRALFAESGVDANKVTFVNIGTSPVVYQAVVAGKIDAGPSLADLLPSADADGVKVLAKSWELLPNYVNWGMYSNVKTIQEKPDVLSRAMAGYIKCHRYVLQPDSKADFVKEAVDEWKAKPAGAEFTWTFYNDNKIIDPNAGLTPQQTDYMQQLNIKSGKQTKVVPFAAVVDPSIVQKALELLKS